MNIETWVEVQQLKKRERLSQRGISRRLGISRGTVIRALTKLPGENNRKSSPQKSKLDPYKPLIKDILEQYPTLSGTRMYEKLKKQGYQGEITILRDYLVTLRGQHREAYVRIETVPGEEAQVDWGYYGLLPFEGYPRKIYFFVMVLSFSRMLYVEFTTSQSLDIFLSCHIQAFKYFGGIPHNILYDNLKSVVISRYVNHIQYNRRFLEFSGYYLFTPKVCNVRRANEKGKVENGVKYIKRNFLAGRTFRDFRDLEQQAWEWMTLTANRRKHGTTGEIPEERFQKEKEYLLSIPEHEYDTTVPIQAKVYSDCRIKYDGNYYSVPAKYILLLVTIRAGKYQVHIYFKEQVIAEHKRCYAKNQFIENPKHYENLLKIKKKAREAKLRDKFLSLAPCCDTYLQGLLGLEKNLKQEITAIMKLVDIYGKYEVIPAIEEALTFQAYGAAYIRNIIAQNRAKREHNPITPLNLNRYPEIQEMDIEARDLKQYDELFQQGEDL